MKISRCASLTRSLGLPRFLFALFAGSFGSLPSASAQIVTTAPQSQSVPAGTSASFSVTASGAAPLNYQWRFNGTDIAGATGATYTLANTQPANLGLYTVVVTSGTTSTTSSAILGLTTSSKLVGSGQEFPDIFHPGTGFTYDQILLGSAAASMKADSELGQILRVSFIDLNDDIVQVEFSGAGTLSLVLDAASGPALPTKYNQNTSYMKGHAGIVLTGANVNTNLTVFSVGRANAVNQTLFRSDVTYDGIADIAFIAITSTDGKFGGLRAANASLFAAKGYTGVYATGIAFSGPVFVNNIAAFGSAAPVMLLGSVSDARVTGGDFAQNNGQSVAVSGITLLNFVAGTTSHGGSLPALVNQAQLVQAGVNVTSQIAASAPAVPSQANGYTGLVADVLQIQQYEPNARSEEEWYRTDRTLVVDHKNPDILYISVEYRGIFKSLDGGKTWQQKTKGIKVYARTDDKTKGCYGEYPVIKMNPANPLHLVAGLSGPGGGFLHPDLPNSQVGGVYQTLDGGENWQLMITDKMNVYVTDVAFDPVNPDTIYYSTASNPASWGGADPTKLFVEKGLIYKTTDRGKTWAELPTGIGQNSSVSNILINPLQPNQINAPTFSAARQSADGSGAGLSTGKDTTVQQLGVLMSATGGTTWESLKPTDNPPLRKGFASANNWQFQYLLPVSDFQPYGLFSDDGGKTFTRTSYMDIVTYDPFDSTGKHAIGYSTVLWTPSDAKFTLFESFDGGKSWGPLGKLPVEIVNPNFVKTRPTSIVWGPQNKNTIYMSGGGGLVWKSTDLGTSWTKLLDYTQLPL